MPPRKLYFENIRVGDELPAMAKQPIDRVQLARYAGATGDFNPLQVDEVAAKAAGLPSVVAPNTIGLGFLGQLVGDWARGAQVKRLSCKFSRILWPGDTLICKGRVADRHGEGGRYLRLLNQAANHPRFHDRAGWQFTTSLERTAALIAPALAHVPVDLRPHRARYVLGMALFALADQAWIIDTPQSDREALPREVFIEDLVKIGLAALRA